MGNCSTSETPSVVSDWRIASLVITSAQFLFALFAYVSSEFELDRHQVATTLTWAWGTGFLGLLPVFMVIAALVLKGKYPNGPNMSTIVQGFFFNGAAGLLYAVPMFGHILSYRDQHNTYAHEWVFGTTDEAPVPTSDEKLILTTQWLSIHQHAFTGVVVVLIVFVWTTINITAVNSGYVSTKKELLVVTGDGVDGVEEEECEGSDEEGSGGESEEDKGAASPNHIALTIKGSKSKNTAVFSSTPASRSGVRVIGARKPA
jgi:hypothetical protein